MSDLFTVAHESNAWACYDCGKCTASCPITRAGAAYSPRRHVLSTNLNQWDEIKADQTIGSCLTCKQCDVRCPAEVDYTSLIRKLRTIDHDEGAEPECPHGGALQSVMRMMAQGGTTQDRLAWLEEGFDTSPDTGSVFFWTGCTMYYDAFFPELEMETLAGSKAAIKILNALGETPVVSPEERCCGHDLLWNGDRKNFECLARLNVDLIEKSGANTVVAPCAECLRTLKIDYEPFFSGSLPRFLHLSEYLDERLAELNLKANDIGRITYQDPCRLGRHLGIYESPRSLFEAIPGLEFDEMRRSKARALCCAGGTWSNCDRFAKQIQVDRLREARTTGAEVLVTACPKCQIHFKCAMKDPNLGHDIKIELRDIAEVVASSLHELGERKAT